MTAATLCRAAADYVAYLAGWFLFLVGGRLAVAPFLVLMMVRG